MIFCRATGNVNHSARSTSGNDWRRPLRGGHSISNMLLREAGDVEVALGREGNDKLAAFLAYLAERLAAALKLPAELFGKLAPGGCLGCSPSAYSPLGIDQAPRSRLLQNGPPG